LGIGSNKIALAAPPPFVDPGSAIFKDQDRIIVGHIFDLDCPECGLPFGHYGKLPTHKVLPFRSIGGESRFIHYETPIFSFNKAGANSGEPKILTTADSNGFRHWLASASTQQQYGRCR